MLIKTINIALGALVAFSVWCAAITFAVLVAIVALRVVVIGGLIVYSHLKHS
jgi:hypothetical protein